MKSAVVVSLTLMFTPVLGLADEAQVEKAIAVIRAAETYDDEAVGFSAEKTETWLAYEQLRKGADRARLEKLTDDENPILRCYAFRALAEGYPDCKLKDILLRHLDDTEEVETRRGCIGSAEMAGDVMFWDAEARLASEASRAIFFRLVACDSKLEARQYLLESQTFPRADRPRIRKLVEGGEPGAIVLLARYRNPEDLPLLRAALRQETNDDLDSIQPAMRAVKHYPDPSLIPELKALEPVAIAVIERGPWGVLQNMIEALAVFEHPDAAGILVRFLERAKGGNYIERQFGEWVFRTVTPYPGPANDPVLVILWEKHRQLNAEALDHLAKRQPEETLRRARADVIGPSGELPERAICALFEYVAATDRALAVRALKAGLECAEINSANSLAYLAAAWKDREFVEPLFKIYSTHWNTNLYLPAARALLCYDDPEIDRRLEVAAREAPTLQKGWGVKRLAKLLAEKPRVWGD